MKPLVFNCPACGQSIEAEEEMAGQKRNCPACQHEFTIDIEAAPVEPPAIEGAARAWNFGFIIALMGLLVWAAGWLNATGLNPQEGVPLRFGGLAVLVIGLLVCLGGNRKGVLESGFVLLVIGLAILPAFFLAGYIPGEIAAGVAAIAGAVLVKK